MSEQLFQFDLTAASTRPERVFPEEPLLSEKDCERYEQSFDTYLQELSIQIEEKINEGDRWQLDIPFKLIPSLPEGERMRIIEMALHSSKEDI